MITGTVKSFNFERGWGFIDPDDQQGDVFIHARELHGIKIDKGLRVGFNVKMTKKGRRAENLIVMLDERSA